jgi:hypothetical protein
MARPYRPIQASWLAAVAHVIHVAQHWWFIEGVRRGHASNEPRASAERQVLKTPLDED